MRNTMVSECILLAFLAAALVAPPALARTITVSGSGGGDFPTIMEAVKDAAPGDEIKVLPGDYTETVIVDKPGISLKAAPAGGRAVSIAGEAFYISARDVSVTGFSIRCETRIDKPAENVVMDGLDFVSGQANKYYLGVVMADPSAEEIELMKKKEFESGVKLSEVVAGSAAAGAGLQAGDIIVEVEGRPVKNQSQLSDAIVGSSAGSLSGKYFRNKRVKVFTATLNKRLTFGLHINGAARVTVRNSRFTGWGCAIIASNNSQRVTIEKNLVRGNETGVVIRDAQATVENNTIVKNLFNAIQGEDMGTGVYVDGSSEAYVYNNIICYNQRGIKVVSARIFKVENNDSYGNGREGNVINYRVWKSGVEASKFTEPADLSPTNLSVDPMFVSEMDNDFHLKPGSPVANKSREESYLGCFPPGRTPLEFK